MLSSQPNPPPEWWRYPGSPRPRRSWGRTVGLALAAVVAAAGLVVFALVILLAVGMASYGSNK
jgi:hypothetical protein